ncbi:MAG: cytochrome c peroxidase [Panacibacter sp.]
MKPLIFVLCCIALFLACSKEIKPGFKSPEDAELYNEMFSASISKKSLLLPQNSDLAAIPQDPKNPLTAAKVSLGQLLFHETRLGARPKIPQGLYTYSCASCHIAESGFQSGLAQGIAEGGVGFGLRGEGRMPSVLFTDSADVLPIRSPATLNTAYQEVQRWDGGFGGTGINKGTENVWLPGTKFANNALGYQGLETIGITGQDGHRFKVDTPWFAANAIYKNLFDQAFTDLPVNQRISQTTVGLSIAAYLRTILANEAPFQKWLRGDETAMDTKEKQGARLFFGKAKCGNCHAGPALNSMAFFALGMSDFENGINGVINVKPGNAEKLGRGGFTKKDSDMYKFKVPQLYNLKDVKYFGHGASFTSVADVVRYKNNAVPQNANVPVTQLSAEFTPLNLTEDEIDKIVKFIEDALYDPNLLRYVPASVPSGNCIPDNDPRARKDRGCQ